MKYCFWPIHRVKWTRWHKNFCFQPSISPSRCQCNIVVCTISKKVVMYSTVHDKWKWTVPRGCHSRQISREMPHAEHLAYHTIINRRSRIPLPLEPRKINRAQNFARQIVDRENVSRFSRDSRFLYSFSCRVLYIRLLHWQENPMCTFCIFNFISVIYFLSMNLLLKQCRILCHLRLQKLSKSDILNFWVIAAFWRKSYVVHTTVFTNQKNTKCRHNRRIRLYCTDTVI